MKRDTTDAARARQQGLLGDARADCARARRGKGLLAADRSGCCARRKGKGVLHGGAACSVAEDERGTSHGDG